MVTPASGVFPSSVTPSTRTVAPGGSEKMSASPVAAVTTPIGFT